MRLTHAQRDSIRAHKALGRSVGAIARATGIPAYEVRNTLGRPWAAPEPPWIGSGAEDGRLARARAVEADEAFARLMAKCGGWFGPRRWAGEDSIRRGGVNNG